MSLWSKFTERFPNAKLSKFSKTDDNVQYNMDKPDKIILVSLNSAMKEETQVKVISFNTLKIPLHQNNINILSSQFLMD